MATSDYDFEFVKAEPIADYKCTICRGLARKPYQVDCCGKIFCKQCLERHESNKHSLSGNDEHDENNIEKKIECPYCRNQGFHSVPDRRAELDILNLDVYCSNKRKGCQWEGKVKEFDAHSSECHHKEIPCTNGCGGNIQRRLMEVHSETQCSKRRYRCPHCHKPGPYSHITSDEHLKLCPDVIVKCTNEGCSETIARKNLKTHSNICPKEIILCTYATVGCQERFKREDAEEHEQQNIHKHLKQSFEKAERLNETVKKMNKKVEDLQTLHEEQQESLVKVIIVMPEHEYNDCLKWKKEWKSHSFDTQCGYRMHLKMNFSNRSFMIGSLCEEAPEYQKKDYNATIELLYNTESSNLMHKINSNDTMLFQYSQLRAMIPSPADKYFQIKLYCSPN